VPDSSPAPDTKINHFSVQLLHGGAIAIRRVKTERAPVLSRKLALISEIDFKGNAKAVAAE